MKNILLLLSMILILANCAVNKKSVKNQQTAFEMNLRNDVRDLKSYAKSHIAFQSNEKEINDSSIIKYNLLPNSLVKKYDVKFYGDANTLLTSLSKHCKFDYIVKGKPTSLTHNVYVNLTSTKMIDILYDIGSQLSNDITVTIDVDVVNEYFNVNLVFE